MPSTTLAAWGRTATLLVVTGVALCAFSSTAAATIVRPAEDQVVRNGKVKLVVTSKGGHPATVDVDGVDVTRRLSKGRKRVYSATLSLGRGLHYGVNDVFVRTRGGKFEHSSFVVARRDNSLMTVTSLRKRTGVAPVRVAVRRASGSSARAYVNGRHRERLRPARRTRVEVRGKALSQELGQALVQVEDRPRAEGLEGEAPSHHVQAAEPDP
jgi:hypothetical protein